LPVGPSRTAELVCLARAGEAAQGPTAAAIANAVFAAIGVRLRDLPLRPERVRAALSA